VTTPHSPGQVRSSPHLLLVGIIIFLGSELMFFAALFGMYFTLRGQTSPWPPAGIEIGFVKPLIFTIVLVSSSFTMQMAVVRVRQGNVRSMKRWIWLTFLMGWIFLAGQFWDYLHVFAGLLAMLVVLGRAAAGAVDRDEHAGLEVVTYYWHFVDAVWIALFLTIFAIR
jgi:cytochrome c oxidase subunit III